MNNLSHIFVKQEVKLSFLKKMMRNMVTNLYSHLYLTNEPYLLNWTGVSNQNPFKGTHKKFLDYRFTNGVPLKGYRVVTKYLF
jgi:hypothetical protein